MESTIIIKPLLPLLFTIIFLKEMHDSYLGQNQSVDLCLSQSLFLRLICYTMHFIQVLTLMLSLIFFFFLRKLYNFIFYSTRSE